MNLQWDDVLAGLCDAVRKLGGQADWDGEYLWIQWPESDRTYLPIHIDGERLLTEV